MCIVKTGRLRTRERGDSHGLWEGVTHFSHFHAIIPLMTTAKINRSVWGWAMYDFANSAYTTSILSVIFSVYFVNSLIPSGEVSFFGWTVKSASLWGFLNSAVMAVTILLSPTLGAW